MGLYLSSPITEKETTSGGNDRISWAASSMQGWRKEMEDSHTTLSSLSATNKISLFSVFDGHRGQKAALFAGTNLPKKISNELLKTQDFADIFKRSLLELDQDLLNDKDYDDRSGCTAVSVLISQDFRIIVANLGDSRIVLSSNGIAVPLSNDHKPTCETESNRIRKAGGFVRNERVNGCLSLSRAIGDFEFKMNAGLSAQEQIVTADAEILIREPNIEDEFIVLACDGIWECMTNQQVVDFVHERIESQSLESIAESLIDNCLAPVPEGSGCDNMTVIIVVLHRGKEVGHEDIEEKSESKSDIIVR